MCAIIGGYVELPLEFGAIKNSLDTMVHRGPDDSGIFNDGPVFLGNRRLSIIDVSGGHQPMSNEDGSVIVVLNGEIYNYRELMDDLKSRGHVFKTNSDTETLVHLWEEHGNKMCSYLRGMFAFAIWDSQQKVLFLGRDRFGKKPLYYSNLDGNNFIFSSELRALKALATSFSIAFTVSNQSIYHYLSLGVVPQPLTIYKECEAMEPGSWMLYHHGRITCKKYWALHYEDTDPQDYKGVLESTRGLIKESVKLRLRSDVPVGVFLSGGIDSSIVAYEAAQISGSSLLSLTVSVPDKAYDESPVARQTSESLGIRNLICPVEFDLKNDILRTIQVYDQPFADSSSIITLKVAQAARAHCKVVLTGDGGDELFAGYNRHIASYYLPRNGFKFPWMISAFSTLSKNSKFKRRSLAGFILRLARSAFGDDATKYLRLTTDMLVETDKAHAWIGEKQRSTESFLSNIISEDLCKLRKQMDCDVRVNLLSALLVKMDMATMSTSLEARSPLLDHTLAEFAGSIPTRYLVSGVRPKTILRDAYRDILPANVILGKKRGFELPMDLILRTNLYDFMMDILGSSSARVSSYLDREFINKLIRKQIMTDRNWAYIVYSLLVLEIWFSQQNGKVN